MRVRTVFAYVAALFAAASSHAAPNEQPFDAWDKAPEWDISCIVRLHNTNLPPFNFLYQTEKKIVHLDIGRDVITRSVAEGETWLNRQARVAVFKSPDHANGALVLLESGLAFYEIRRSESEPFARSLRALCDATPVKQVPKDT